MTDKELINAVTDETPIEIAARLSKLLEGRAPSNVVVAVFVFRNSPEENSVGIGWVTSTTVARLRKWMKLWLRDTKPPREESKTVQ